MVAAISTTTVALFAALLAVFAPRPMLVCAPAVGRPLSVNVAVVATIVSTTVAIAVLVTKAMDAFRGLLWFTLKMALDKP